MSDEPKPPLLPDDLPPDAQAAVARINAQFVGVRNELVERFDRLDRKLEKTEGGIDEVLAEFRALNKRLDQRNERRKALWAEAGLG